jgi:hypothetical protein
MAVIRYIGDACRDYRVKRTCDAFSILAQVYSTWCPISIQREELVPNTLHCMVICGTVITPISLCRRGKVEAGHHLHFLHPRFYMQSPSHLPYPGESEPTSPRPSVSGSASMSSQQSGRSSSASSRSQSSKNPVCTFDPQLLAHRLTSGSCFIHTAR